MCRVKWPAWPMTVFYRDGCCNTGQEDIGSHTVCAVCFESLIKARAVSARGPANSDELVERFNRVHGSKQALGT